LSASTDPLLADGSKKKREGVLAAAAVKNWNQKDEKKMKEAMKKKKWFLAVFRRCLMFVYASVDVEN
jgi:hypothetical protein